MDVHKEFGIGKCGIRQRSRYEKMEVLRDQQQTKEIDVEYGCKYIDILQTNRVRKKTET